MPPDKDILTDLRKYAQGQRDLRDRLHRCYKNADSPIANQTILEDEFRADKAADEIQFLRGKLALAEDLLHNAQHLVAHLQRVNVIVIDDFSDPQSRASYMADFPDDAKLREQHEEGEQCGGCAFFAPLNADYGICCHDKSQHYKETVFEHFTCHEYEGEGWGAHSFCTAEQRRMVEGAAFVQSMLEDADDPPDAMTEAEEAEFDRKLTEYGEKRRAEESLTDLGCPRCPKCGASMATQQLPTPDMTAYCRLCHYAERREDAKK